MTDPALGPARVIDHLVYAVVDASAALDRLAAATGVRPVEGGRHIGRGTRNWLATFSPTAYLEVIAVDHDNPVPAGTSVSFGLDSLESDRLITWAVHPAEIDAALEAARGHGADHGQLNAMSRVGSDGGSYRGASRSATHSPTTGSHRS